MWSVLVVISVTLVVLYCLLLLVYRFWFLKLRQLKPAPQYKPYTRFSVIIPARNESENISACIKSIWANDYPKDLFEIIVVDDFSADDTANIVTALCSEYHNLSVLRLQDFVSSPLNSYKKKSIETGIAHSRYEWVVTTDADCIVPVNWLRLFDNVIQLQQPQFVAAPVMFHHQKGLLYLFQSLDFISLQGITAASVNAGALSMCNGANLAYSKQAFYAVDGFKNVDHIASGDDMLLMHKIQKSFPASATYLFNQHSIVFTEPMQTWKDFFNQRIRWASKATNYNDKRIFFVLLLVYLVNVTLLLLPFLSVSYPPLFFIWLKLIACKTIFELLFMFPVSTFFSRRKQLWWFPLMQPLHIIYTVISGWLGKFGKYEWKGRKVN